MRKAPAASRPTAASSASAPQQKGKGFGSVSPRWAKWLTYGLGFLLIYGFFTLVYGDVIQRAEQTMYVSPARESMDYLLSQPCGWLFYYARWAMLVCKWAALGGAVLALVMTLSAMAFDYVFQLPRAWKGIGFLVPAAEMGWMMWRGTNLYYKSEPSWVVLLPLAVLLVLAVLAVAVALVKHASRQDKRNSLSRIRPWGALVAVVVLVGMGIGARTLNENVILTARLKNLADKQDWETMIDDALKAKQPTRAIAAYYAIALEETDQLLDRMYEIRMDFPKLHLDQMDGSEEYGLFVTDCNFHAGLLNAAYRTAMDYAVMAGPSLSSYKRMAICALLNGEKALCHKYLALISEMPFESSFVDKYTNLLNNPQLIKQDAELKHVLSLFPQEDHFEQNYMPPAFLGYNVGLQRGSDNTLVTSAAACLYSKDLRSFVVRAQIMKQKGMRITGFMQEAIAIAALNQPELLQAFPEVGQFVPGQIRSFLMDAKPYVNDREALRKNLLKDWLGTYVYYYYTENNDPSQTVKAFDKKNDDSKAGVN